MRRCMMIRGHRDKAVTLLGKDEFINNQWQIDQWRRGAGRPVSMGIGARSQGREGALWRDNLDDHSP
jgi:hypothetical protein